MANNNDTIAVRNEEELNLDVLEPFIKENVEGLSDDPLKLEQFSTGASNLTYLLRIGDWEAVLRRPPNGLLDPKAMKREYNVLKEVNPVFPVVPKPYIFHEDTALIGAPFFIMERREGVLLKNALRNEDGTKKLFGEISNSMVDTLVKLHGIDYKETGLVNMVRPEGFLERQIGSWIGRYEKVKLEEKPGIERIIKWLQNDRPDSQDPTIIHYDYHLNNVNFKKDDLSKIVGLFDWELSTVGDPLADLAVALLLWYEKDDPEELKANFPLTSREGFMSRDEFAETYAKKSGRDLSQFNFYMGFAAFRFIVISQQIYYRYKKGHTKDERFSVLDRNIDLMTELALRYTSR